MIKFTPEEIEEFRSIWRHEFGEEITVDQAQLEAIKLMELYPELAKSLPERRLQAPVLVRGVCRVHPRFGHRCSLSWL